MTFGYRCDFRLRRAVDRLRRGGVIAYPTEAVYGLGADPDNANALRRVLALKQRPAHKGLILIGASLAALKPYLAELTEAEEARMAASWPGPVTWLAPAATRAPPLVTGGSERIAVRVPGHDLARALCAAWGGAVVSTSANRAGMRPLRSGVAVRLAFGDRIDDVITAPVGNAERPTTIRDLRSGEIVRCG